MVQCTQPPPQLKLPESKITELTDDENCDSLPKPEKRTRIHHIERHRSCAVTLSDIELNGLQPHRLPRTTEISKSPGGGSQCSLHEETPTDTNASHRHAIADAEWEPLERAIVYFSGQPIGTVAAMDKSQGAALNYDQVFMRDFIPSTLAFLMKGEHLIVKDFLVETVRLQSREMMVDLFKLGQGDLQFLTTLAKRQKAYWLILVKRRGFLLWIMSYGGLFSFVLTPNGQGTILWLKVLTAKGPCTLFSGCLSLRDVILSPALLCADGCSMIDRRMVIYGYPIEIQALFFMAMRCALSLLKQDSYADFVNHSTKRTQALSYHLQSYYWLNFQRLNDIYRYKTEEYSQTALNKFNVVPESIPDWIFDFMPSWGGYFIGNVSPARMDFRWFCMGNFIAILSSLATGEQAEAILDLEEERWQEIVSEMPLEICPAMENQEGQLATECVTANTSCSSHNGGSHPDHNIITEGCELSDYDNVDFSQIWRKIRSLISIEEGPDNEATILLDTLDSFLETYISGIMKLRHCCEIYGIRKDLSDIGHRVVVFTTPPQGTFYFNVKYRGRIIKLAIYLRDLYVMGWKGKSGTFEMREMNDKKKFYMSGPVTALYFKKNYRFLAPSIDKDGGPGSVGNVLIGLPALQMAFEVMHKSEHENTFLRQAVATFAVHLSEAARIQSILKDVCVLSAKLTMDTLDSRSNNSIWVNNYGHYAEEEMQRMDDMFSGKVPQPIEDCKSAKDLEMHMSESDILNQIRIFPCDVYKLGIFRSTEIAPLEPSEADVLRKSMTPSPEHTSRKGYPKGRGGGGGGGGVGSSSTGGPVGGGRGEGDVGSSTWGAVGGGGSLPLYLLEDWGQQQEELPLSVKNERFESMLWVEDFLDLSPCVKRFITPDGKEQILRNLQAMCPRAITGKASFPIIRNVSVPPVVTSPITRNVLLQPIVTRKVPSNRRSQTMETIARKFNRTQMTIAARRMIQFLF